MRPGPVVLLHGVYARTKIFRFLPLLCALLWATAALAQSEALTLPRNLTQLVDESEVIVQGRVTAVFLAPHPQLNNLLMVVVTLQVEDSPKGTAARTFTFQQAAIDRRDQQQLLNYRVGQHLLLAMIRPSVYGLSSPAGMQQGRFTITPDVGGKLQVTNGFGNAGLLSGVATEMQSRGTRLTPEVRAMLADQSKPGPVPLVQLKSLIRSIATRNSPR